MLFNMEDCLNWLIERKNIYNWIVGKLISAEELNSNKSLYFDDSDNFDGLVAVFAFRIPGYEFMGDHDDVYVYINDVVIKILNLDVDRIRMNAIENMRQQLSVRKMDEVLAEYMSDLSSVPLGIVSTNYAANGAFYLCDLETLCRVCGRICSNDMRKVIFMPSSADELLVVTDPEITPEMAKSLVYECNREPNIVNDALTDHVYIYDRDNNAMTEI